MKPCHLFRHKDSCFAYHLDTGRFIRVEKDAYELLELRDRLGPDEATAAFLRSHPGKEKIVSETDELERAGFFEPAAPVIADEAEFERELDSRCSGSCNNLVLSVASGCNLACRYCYCGVCRDKLPDLGLMSEETAMLAVDGLFKSADPSADIRVTFFGGEPLLNKRVIFRTVKRCNEWAEKHGVRAKYSITTNATLMDEDTARLIADNNFGLMVSLDGPKELHDAQCPTRGGEGSYDLAVAGIRLLMKYRKNVTVRCTMAHPAPDAMRLIEFFRDFGFTRVVLGTVDNPAFPSECDFTESDEAEFSLCIDEKIIPWMLSERAEGRDPVYDPFTDIDDFQSEKEHPEHVRALRCGACHGAMAVGPDGTLYPCHRFAGMKDWALGDIATGADMEKCKRFWRNYRAAMRSVCDECWACRICTGPCPWEIARADGTFVRPQRTCAGTRTWIEQGVHYLDSAERLGLNAKKGNTK